MEEIEKHSKSESHKEFEKLLSEDLGNRKFKEGEITTGIIEEIGKKFVFIDLGLKSSGAIPVEEFKLTKELDKIEIGSKIDVLLDTHIKDVCNMSVENEFKYPYEYLPVLFNISMVVSIVSEDFADVSENII